MFPTLLPCRITLAAGIATVLAMLALAPPVAGSNPGSVPRFERSACPIQFPLRLTVDCGVLTVPENRVKDNGRTVRLPVAIVRTDNPSPAPDPIVYVTGGPAFNEIDVFSAEFFTSLPFAKKRDFILYNQRGVGFSDPRLGCDEFDDIREATFPVDPTPDQYLVSVAKCRDRLAGQGIDLDAYNSAEDAADLRDLRIALGYSEWNVYTLSAGGVIALTAMRLYPGGIRSVILDSAFGTQYEIRGPDVWRPQNRTLEMVFVGCAANAACNAAYPRLRTRFYDRVHALRLNPIVLNFKILGGGTVAFTIDGDQLLINAAGCTDPFCAPTLPGWMDMAAKGDVAGFFAHLVGGPLGPPLPNDPILSEGKTGVFHCHDYIAFEPDSELVQAARELPEFRVALLTLRFIYVPSNTEQACQVWRVGRAEFEQHRPVTSAIPALVLTGEWDNNVSPLHDEKIASTLSNSFFFQFPGIGHVTLFSGLSGNGNCPARIAGEFIDAPTRAPHSGCIATMSDLNFTPPSAGFSEYSSGLHRDPRQIDSPLQHKPR